MRALLRRAVALAAVFVRPRSASCSLKPPGQTGDGVVFNLLTTAFDRLDAAILLSFDNPSYMLLALLAVLFGVGLWRGWIVVHRRMVAPLAALALAAIFMPEWAMGGWGVHMRLPAVLGALAFASAEFRLDRNAARALAASAAIVLAYNAFALMRSWVAYDRQFAEFRAAAQALPPEGAADDGARRRRDRLSLRPALLAHGGVRHRRARRLHAAAVHDQGPAHRAHRSGVAGHRGRLGRARLAARTSTSSTILPPAGSTTTRTSPTSFPI